MQLHNIIVTCHDIVIAEMGMDISRTEESSVNDSEVKLYNGM